MERMEDKLDKLFAEYRATSIDPEPSADFMPGLWRRIEARRAATVSIFRHWAQVCVMASVALTLLIGAVLIPKFQSTDSSSYLEALSAEHSADYVQMLAGGSR